MTIALGVMGCGLIGGSLALALRRAQEVSRVVGYDPQRSCLEQALALGVVDEAAHTPLDLVRVVDVLVLAVPVATTAACLHEVAGALPPHTLVMDVGSTKTEVMAAARHALGSKVAQFVPAHPIAGKEQSGVAHAEADLFTGRRVVLTPADDQDPLWVQRASSLWEATGARVCTMSAQDHDEALAAVSHLPHLLAYAYMQAVDGQAKSAQFLGLAGSGFRDFTRIAAADGSVWRDIFLTNSSALAEQLTAFRQSLRHLEDLINSGQAEPLGTQLQACAERRRRWGQEPDSHRS